MLEKENLFKTYLECLDKGEYIIPPILVIEEIAKRRYVPENLDIIKTGVCPLISTSEDFKKQEVFDGIFDRYIDGLDEDRIRIKIKDKLLIKNYYTQFVHEITIIIKYPEVLITNSKGLRHTIRDLFIKTSFTDRGSLTGAFTMGRSTYTEKELIVGYKHSHHMGIDPHERELKAFESTCLGSGVLASSTNYLRRTTTEEFDPIQIMSYFANIDAYVAWESLEGVPYQKMEYINNTEPDGNQRRPIPDDFYSYSAREVRQFLSILINNESFCSQLELIPTIKNGLSCYEIKTDLYKLLKLVTSFVDDPTLDYFRRRNLLCSMGKDDLDNPIFYFLNPGGSQGYRRRLVEELKRREPISLFRFKGEMVYLKILDDEESNRNVQELETVVVPEMILGLIEKLEKEINVKNGRNKFNQSSL